MAPGFLKMAQYMKKLLRIAISAAALCMAGTAQAKPAKNVILFLGDAGGLPTLTAAAIFANDRAHSLYIHSMPYLALTDTSSLDQWVTDSAAGMTAIVTGAKTNHYVVSMVPDGRGGYRPVKSILEHAEERGLSTGVITNMPIWDATPAACYAHLSDRFAKADAFRQLLAPRFGNGVDIIVGKDRKAAEDAFAGSGITAQQAFEKAGYVYSANPAAIGGGVSRAAIIRDDDYAPIPAVEAAIRSLSRNRKGYFLMVEWDMHTDDPVRGLRHVGEMDELIRRVSQAAGDDTLILFVADHSFGLTMREGSRSSPFAPQYAAAMKPGVTAATNPLMPVNGSHGGDDVVAIAQGPGAQRLRGFIPNTRLFSIMMEAFGWK